MTSSYIIFNVIPLLILMLFSLMNELKTGKILNIVNYPALVYFLAINLKSIRGQTLLVRLWREL